MESDGFIPNAYGMRQTMPLHPVVKNYGAYAILRQLSGSLEGNLKEIFPDIHREISVIAMLQLVTGCRGRRIKREFEASYLNDIHPDLACSDYTVRSLVGKLGTRSGDMEACKFPDGKQNVLHLPLQYNTKRIPEEFAGNIDDHKFDGCFTYKGRNIWHKTLDSGMQGNKVYIYRDDQRKLQAEVKFMQKKEGGCEGLDNASIIDDKRRGMFAFVSNTGATARQLYMSYKERWDKRNNPSVSGSPLCVEQNSESTYGGFIDFRL